MTRTFTPYDNVLARTEPVPGGFPDEGPVEVRDDQRDSRDSIRSRPVHTFYVVHHGREETLFESRPARPYDQNPSAGEELARAKGFASGFLAGADGD